MKGQMGRLCQEFLKLSFDDAQWDSRMLRLCVGYIMVGKIGSVIPVLHFHY